MKWNEMRYLYPAHMINQQHKEEVNHVRAADCDLINEQKMEPHLIINFNLLIIY